MKNLLGLLNRTTLGVIVLSFACVPNATAQVVINEIFYHAPDDLDLEYVELFNVSDTDADLSGWKLDAGIKYEFPAGSKVKAGGFVVITSNSELLKEFYEVTPVGEFKKSLSNSGDQITLINDDGKLIDEVSYRDRAPWPVSADGYSASLERVYARGATDVASNWEASDLSADYDRQPAGTPGQKNSVAADALPPSISKVDWEPKQAKPETDLLVTAQVDEHDSIESVVLHYRHMEPGKAGEEKTTDMSPGDGGQYMAKIKTGDKRNRILNFWVVAKSKSGGVGSNPRINDLRSSHSVYVNDPVKVGRIPVLQFFHIGKKAFDAGENYRDEQQQQQRNRGYGGRRGYGGFGRRDAPRTALPPQGHSAVVYTNPATGESEVFDFVNVVRRKSGWKVRFHKDKPLLGMTTINLLYEPNEATILNESLAYELYKSAGNASYDSGYMRLMINGEPAGYHLYFEQPNGNFFRRHEIKNNGDLYKLIWMGNAELSQRIPQEERPQRYDIAGRHEKKSNRHAGYQDLVELIEKLEDADTDDAMWKLIEQNFDVENVVNYFAVNSLISHWDGFFNNYFLYYDRKGTGKWSLYPWDQDSTWSQRGGIPEELYKMPLFFGAAGATPQGIVEEDRNRDDRRGSFGGRGFGGRRGGGFGWWRDGGEISRPLLANPEFYKRFLARLGDLTETVFNEKVFGKKIDALRVSLEPEVRLRAQMRGADETDAVAELDRVMNALHQHLVSRRAFVKQNLQN